jgi:Single-strand binding protein family
MSTGPNINTVTLVGQLTSDPVLRGMSDGRNICDLRLAVNDQRDQPPLFIDVARSVRERTGAPSTYAGDALSP